MSDQFDESAVVIEPAEPQVRTRAKPKSRSQDSASKPKTQPPYAVIVENDDLHTMGYVVELLQKIFGYDEQKAYVLMLQVHLSGQAVVWSGALELAELKRDQIRGYGPDLYAIAPVTFPLGVRIEPLLG